MTKREQRTSVDAEDFLVAYFERYHQAIFGTEVRAELIELKDLIVEAHARGNKTVIAGNGGSAAIAAHCAIDFTKNARALYELQ